MQLLHFFFLFFKNFKNEDEDIVQILGLFSNTSVGSFYTQAEKGEGDCVLRAHLSTLVLQFWLIDLKYVVKEHIYALLRHAVKISLPAGRRLSSSGTTPTPPNKILRAKIVLPYVGYICIAGSNLNLSYVKSVLLVVKGVYV